MSSNVLCLNDGNKIPQIGLGTWKAGLGETKMAIYTAIKCGYRHIDAAYIYNNQSEVGLGIKKAIDEGIVKREELFITDKCWLTYLAKDRVKECLDKELKLLGLDYLDLYLIHWPMGFKQTSESNFPEANGLIEVDETIDFVDSWKAFEELKKLNFVKSIGVSNFNSNQLKRLLANCEIKPVCNQIECHPYLNQNELIKFCNSNSIHVVCYCPLGSSPATTNSGHSKNIHLECPRLINDPLINELAKKHNKSNAQILIRYQIERNLIVIPKSTNEQRIKENLNVFDFKLDSEDMDKLNNINKKYRFNSFDVKGLINHKEYPFLIDY